MRGSNIQSAQQFYVDALGFSIKTELPSVALFVAAGNYHHHIRLNNWLSGGGGNNSAEYYGLAQFEIGFPSVESRQQTIAQLITHAHTVDTNEDIPIVFDPFNNQIALTICKN